MMDRDERKMCVTLDFVFTPTDWLQLSSYRRGRLSFGVRRLVALIFGAYAFWNLIDSGLDWHFGLCILMAVSIGIPFIVTRTILSFILAIMRPTIHMLIDNDRISIESNRSQQQIAWSSFAMSGIAIEYTDHFVLECGRGSVWIPKRAFDTKDTMEEFRVLVAGKMGGRCKFNPRQPDCAA